MAELARRGVELLRPALRERREAEELRIRILKERRLADLRWMMAHPEGRRIVAKLMASARLQDTTYHPDERMTERLEGARDLAVAFAAELIDADRKGWLQMLDEAWIEAVHANPAS